MSLSHREEVTANPKNADMPALERFKVPLPSILFSHNLAVVTIRHRIKPNPALLYLYDAQLTTESDIRNQNQSF